MKSQFTIPFRLKGTYIIVVPKTDFENVEIGQIDGHVFNSIQVDTIRFSKSKIDLLESKAFNDVHVLKNLEITKVTCENISDEAFKNIQVDKNLKLDMVSLGTISSMAFINATANSFELTNLFIKKVIKEDFNINVKAITRQYECTDNGSEMLYLNHVNFSTLMMIYYFIK